jgi:hypothetical protein
MRTSDNMSQAAGSAVGQQPPCLLEGWMGVCFFVQGGVCETVNGPFGRHSHYYGSKVGPTGCHGSLVRTYFTESGRAAAAMQGLARRRQQQLLSCR